MPGRKMLLSSLVGFSLVLPAQGLKYSAAIYEKRADVL